MLSRELCEALAEALPEVRYHNPQQGDWYYIQSAEGDPVLCRWAHPRFPVGSVGYYHDTRIGAEPGLIRGSGWGDPADIWCPRLDQLAKLAMPFWCALFRYFGGLSAGEYNNQDDPETAIAKCLIREVRNHADPSEPR